MTKLLPALILALSGSFLFAAPPAIGNIRIEVDTNTATVAYSVSPDSYCWVRYGIASGTYLWSSVSFSSSPASPGACVVPINGLEDGVTYFFLPTARPNPDDETDICDKAACGAVERSATTPPASAPHLPAAPATVSANLLSEPDTKGYAVVILADGGAAAGHECVASASVKAPPGYSWRITAGQTLSQIIAAHEMTFGTVFQVPQGLTCVVPPSDGRGHGYVLPQLAADPLATGGSIDSANHRWIVFRSAPGGAADFAPFGARTGPAFFGHYGRFKSVTANNSGSFDTGGIIFSAPGGGKNPVHHIWVENLEFEVDASQKASYDPFFSFALGENGQTPPHPVYMVLRANYFHFPDRSDLRSGVPSVQGGIMGTVKGQVAIAGNYMDNIYFTKAGIPQGIYFQDCGSVGSCPGGPALIENNYFMGMGMSLYVEVNNHAAPSPHDFVVTHNAFYWPYETTHPYAVAVGQYGCRNQIEFKGVKRATISGNFINGQWACANTGDAILTFNAVDLTIQSNYVTDSASGFGLNGTGNGDQIVSYGSSGNRIKVFNNILFNLGRSRYQAGGGGLGATAFEMESSPSNVTIVNNTVGPIGNDNGPSRGYFYPWMLFAGGGGPIAGLTVKNNIMPFGLGQTYYGGGIGVSNVLAATSTLSHPATPVPNNTTTPVNFAAWLGTIAGYAGGPDPVSAGRPGNSGGGMQGASVIEGGSGYPDSGNLSFTGCAAAPRGTYTATGGVIRSVAISDFGSGCDPAAFTVSPSPGGRGRGASLRPAYGLTPAYSWTGNIDYCTTFQGSDMSMNTCNSLRATMPPGDVWASGATTSLRLAAAGLVKVSLSDYHCVTPAQMPCTAGANPDQVEAELGIVSHISLSAAGATAERVSYLAPDSRACSIDISADRGYTWTRTTDTGGPGRRAVTLTGLSANTDYRYRLLCYYDQTEAWFAFPSDSSNLSTSGTFRTQAP